ncbi:MAG: hypothetical protein R3250_00070 [Melioribacteraceae bacterium]|nr:hypothetical protein [Melioribacteraceae bacterium]
MSNYASWVEEDTVTTGTGAITLGTNLITGSTSFQQAFGSGTVVIPYSIKSGDNREAGEGSYNGTTNVLTRTTPTATLVGGVYNDTLPTPINLTGTSNIISPLTAYEYTNRLLDAVFPTWAGNSTQTSTVINVGANTDVDFSASNKHALTGTGATTINNFTFPQSFAMYFLYIPANVTITAVTATNKIEYGINDLTAGKAHIMTIYWDSTTAHWQTSEEV